MTKNEEKEHRESAPLSGSRLLSMPPELLEKILAEATIGDVGMTNVEQIARNFSALERVSRGLQGFVRDNESPLGKFNGAIHQSRRLAKDQYEAVTGFEAGDKGSDSHRPAHLPDREFLTAHEQSTLRGMAKNRYESLTRTIPSTDDFAPRFREILPYAKFLTEKEQGIVTGQVDLVHDLNDRADRIFEASAYLDNFADDPRSNLLISATLLLEAGVPPQARAKAYDCIVKARRDGHLKPMHEVLVGLSIADLDGSELRGLLNAATKKLHEQEGTSSAAGKTEFDSARKALMNSMRDRTERGL
ncbi:hypothetical protein [Mesorhizobium sp. GbtcB19]|uniref:hypothetical protein n=1 Tax=Mesorhizobium sp. GbtcB19 TaxID=2824764 RepID=UPI001C30D19D|nr:hypothetical protein [Mesorhizobium sp. GbtcB19]